ncbi:DeoR/GlpR family transcriptional regulator of sugar metabolism [Caldalkalibacillus uzonensis]|uniref:DeoR/GlpR family transcriptional regulator of sugar metabolism n=1 Tax=Caldalkalibacillus uzonensis TaxID=353224 RepID=A0ABU0CQL5_9BACI|nr:DeoR/GlpR family DNA-binding transcription regulator [Caldalkalibacillus uzonensis]MDQ0338690.1 DeoR/GlpR family transcriptional regulator of sugar metabolism [Caldalkalibacillus uzonensis]
MLVAERQEKIVEIVNERGSVRVSELSQIFGVTEETIRRDLEKLEHEGRLKRSHGGAISISGNSEIPYFEREVVNVEEKKEVAKATLNYIEPHDSIILDASSTAWYVAKILPDIPLTVVTNSMKVAFELANKEKIAVISTGGNLTPASLSFIGPLAERSLELYHVNKAFISCHGLHPKWGISESNELQALVKRKMIDIADRVYLLADYSKFGVQAFTLLCDLDKIEMIITDSKTDQALIQQFEDVSVQVTRAKEVYRKQEGE